MSEVARWLAAALIVTCAHAAIVLWVPRQLVPAGTGLQQAPIFVDLEPAEAPLMAEPQAGQASVLPAPEAFTLPDFAPSQLLDSPPIIESHDPVAPTRPDFAPPTDLASPPVVEVPVPTPRSPVLSASSRPAKRPQQVRSAETTPRDHSAAAERRPQRSTAPASRAADAAPATARKQAGQAAGPSKSQIAQWQATVGARIARHMSRTRLSGRGGARVQIAVTVNRTGATTARLASSSGNPRHDSALNAQAARMPRMPAPPAGQAQSFLLPIAVR